MILASKSPRRKELLSYITTDFVIDSKDVDETLPQGISPADAVLHLSEIKAMPFAHTDDIVIGADTVVAFDNTILGQPENRKHAKEMLQMLSGREHSVFTGVTVIKGEKIKSFYVQTRVKFFDLTDNDIEAYLDTNEYADKAGAYGIQGYGSLLVEEIYGDYFNVVGLPVSKLNQALKDFTPETNS